MKIFLLIFLAFLNSCAVHQAQVPVKTSTPKIPTDSIPEPPVEETKSRQARIKESVEKILAVGETSGADALAGFVGVFSAE